MHEGASGRAVGTSAMDALVSVLLALLGAVAIWESRRLGAGWGAEGPQTGYFPFYLGLILLLASLGNLAIVALKRNAAGPDEDTFLSRSQLGLVLSILLPTVVYVAMILVLGIYVSSTLLVVYFMTVLGGYRLLTSIPFGVATALAVFAVFEVWFLISLPKGPLEAWLGL